MKKFFNFSLLVSIFITLFVSCGKEAATSDKKVSIDIFQFKVEFKDKFTEVAQEYMKEHPNIQINVTTVGGGDDYGASLKTRFSSGNEPAIFNVGGPQDVSDYQSKLEDLSNTEIAKKALPKTLDGVTVDGKVFGLPYNQEGYGFIYNKAVFEKAGINPEEIKTYAKLVEAVNVLNQKKDELGLKAVFAFPAKETWVTGLHLSNVFLSPEFEGDIKKAFNSKTVEFKYAKQFKDIVDLQSKNSVQPTVSLDYSQQVEKLFSTGKVAMIQQGNWALGSIEQIDPELAKNIGLLPIPVEGVAEGKLPVGVPMYWAINKDKDEAVKKAAVEFLEWLYTSEKGKDYVLNQFKFIPAYDGYDVSKISDPLSKDIYKYSTEGNTINWVFMGYPSGWGMNVLGAEIQKYLSNQTSWEELVNTSKEAWQKDR